MGARPVLMAACIVARDPRADVAAVLEAWTRDAQVPVNVQERGELATVAAVLDDFEAQPFLAAAARGMRPGLAAALHLGTRVNGRGDSDPVEVSTRSIDGARALAEVASAGQILVSSDLGTFLSIGRARFADHLETLRVRGGDGRPVDAYRVRTGSAPATNPARMHAHASSPLDTLRRSQLVERLGSVLTPHLGPIAPVMLRRLPAGRMSAREFIDAILKDVPDAQFDAVKRAVEEEIRRLR